MRARPLDDSGEKDWEADNGHHQVDAGDRQSCSLHVHKVARFRRHANCHEPIRNNNF